MKNHTHVGIDFETEDSIEIWTKIAKHNLSQKQIKDENGVLVQCGPRDKIWASESQQQESQ